MEDNNWNRKLLCGLALFLSAEYSLSVLLLVDVEFFLKEGEGMYLNALRFS